MNRHRQSVAALELELSTHIRERLGDSLHRASAETGVALESRGERMAGDYTGEKAGGGSAVSTVEGELRRAQATQPQAAYPHLTRKLRNFGTK